MLTIGDLSRKTGVKISTIRYYEQIVLMDAAERSGGNQRRYAVPESEWLSCIKHARDLGLSINAIRALIEPTAHPNRPCEQVDRIASEQLNTVRARIEKLQRSEKELKRITTRCANDQIMDCYVIRALAHHELCEGDH